MTTDTTTERAQLATVNDAQAVSFSNGILAEQNAAAWIEYATAENNLKAQTRKTYERGIRQFATYCAERGISTPDRSTVMQFKRDLTESGKAPATVNLYLVAVRLFFRWASDCGLYREAIADHVKGIREEAAGTHKRDALTSEQAKELLQSIDRSTLKGARDYAFIVTMMTCGLRDIEAVRADKGDIRRNGNATVIYVQGKGKTCKNDFVKLDPWAEKAIREYLARRAAEEGKTLAADAPLFAGVGNKNNGGRMTTRAVSGIIKSALRGIGLDDPRLTAHSLRHTAITLALIGNGGDIRAAQQFARHSKVTTTETYAHDLDRLANNCSSIVASMIAG